MKHVLSLPEKLNSEGLALTSLLSFLTTYSSSLLLRERTFLVSTLCGPQMIIPPSYNFKSTRVLTLRLNLVKTEAASLFLTHLSLRHMPAFSHSSFTVGNSAWCGWSILIEERHPGVFLHLKHFFMYGLFENHSTSHITCTDSSRKSSSFVHV